MRGVKRGIAAALASAALLAGGGQPAEGKRDPSVIVDGTVLEGIPRVPGGRSPLARASPAALEQAAPPASGPKADPQFSDRPIALTFFLGVSIDDAAFSETVLQPWNGTWGSDTLVGMAGSYEVARFWRWFTLEPELGVAGRFGDTGSVELWGALYLRFDGFPWRDHLYTTVAVSTGLNWISRLPAAEAGSPSHPEPNTSQVLHYFAPEITLALPQHRQYALVLRYHHRSGMFGAINGVEDGSNVISLGLRYRLPVR